MDVIFFQIKRELERARRPWLVSHRNPDGDTLGAMLAFGLYLEGIGKSHLRFCVDRPAAPYSFLPGIDLVRSDPEGVRQLAPDLLCTFDSGDLRHSAVADLVALLAPRPRIVVFDHHATNERFGDINAVLTGAASTTEVVYRYLKEIGATLTPAIATNLLAGLCTDTSNFSNPATTTAALRLGAELISHGAEFSKVFNALFRNKSLGILKLWGRALERLQYSPAEELATTALFLRDFEDAGVAPGGSSEGLSNFLSAVLKVPTLMVLREASEGKVFGSLRTVEERDVSEIAKRFGGGGHKKAAGFSTKGTIRLADGRWSVVGTDPAGTP